MQGIRTSKKGKHHKSTANGNLTGSFLASIALLAFFLVICLWVPLAVASEEVAAPAADDTTTAGPALPDPAEPAADAPNLETAPADAAAAGDETTVTPAPGAPVSGEVPATTDEIPAAGGSESAVQDVTGGNPGTSSKEPAIGGGNGGSNAQTAGSEENGEDEECCPPPYTLLELICGSPYWDSTYDYTQSLLSIDYELRNTGTETAYKVKLVKAVATNGVTAAWFSSLTYWEQIEAGAAVYFTIKWFIPENVGSYVTTLEVCAEGKPDCEEEPECPEGGCPPVDPCIENPESCEPIDPCIENPESCQPIDPCLEDPKSCEPPDPCITDPASCSQPIQPIEDPDQRKPQLEPQPINTDLQAGITRAALPSTGLGMLGGTVIGMILLALGITIPATRFSRKK